MERRDVTVNLGTARAVAGAGLGGTPSVGDAGAGGGHLDASEDAVVATQMLPVDMPDPHQALYAAGVKAERERISLGIEAVDTHQIEGTPLRDVLVFREDVFKVIHDA